MNIKERTLAVLRGEEPDRVPWLIYNELLPRGYVSRQLRNKGLGLKVSVPICKVETPNVSVESKRVEDIVYTTYHTPVGSVSTKQRTGLPAGTGGSWAIEYMIKDVSDYKVVGFMVEDTVYVPDPKPVLEAEQNLGNDGIVFVWAERSPLQKALIEFMGYKTFAIELHRHPKEFDELLRVIEKKANEYYRIVAESPVEIVNGSDNINSIVTSPKLFEKYCVPFYSKQARLLHKKDKIWENHFNGKLGCLKDLISKTDLDVIEAFTPPPMGDLPLAEARVAWRNKTISLNFPESVFLLGSKAVKKCTLELLRSAALGDRFIMSVTEDIPTNLWERGLMAITNVLLKHGKYPLSLL